MANSTIKPNGVLVDCKDAMTAGAASVVLANGSQIDGKIHCILLFFKLTSGVNANVDLLTLPPNVMSMSNTYSFMDFSATYGLQRTTDGKLKSASSIPTGTIGCFIPY